MACLMSHSSVTRYMFSIRCAEALTHPGPQQDLDAAVERGKASQTGCASLPIARFGGFRERFVARRACHYR